MASLSLLMLSAVLISAAQAIPAGHGERRGLDVSVGRATHRHRNVPDLLQYEDKMRSYPQSEARANDLFYHSQAWRDRGLGQALQRLVETDQRREQEEDQKAVYLGALLQLLSDAKGAGLGVEEDNQEQVVQDYDESGRGVSIGRSPADWQSLMELQLAEALLDRMDFKLFQTLLQRAGQTQGVSYRPSSKQDTLRRLVARIISTIGPQTSPVLALSGHRRRRRDLSLQTAEPISPNLRTTRRALEDMASPLSSIDSPLLRVKRLEEGDEEDKKLPPYGATLQRIKRIDTLAASEETNHVSRRHRRAAVNYNSKLQMDQILEYMRG
ncbi:uncharacterized protein LOC101159720 [Oryzias latipes]|uniref:uncharacterized protein LOC101159720 n=1 Tax=Oryzias latipes TaxID=8090 RepID=UPI0002A4877F|nr:uncharacterized protein LOC101159720 [Oryzias latipes]